MKKKIAYSYLIGDLFHFGHLQLLKKAHKLSDYHICGIVDDRTASNWQSPLICNYFERKSVIKNLNYVDEILIQKSFDPSENLIKIKKRFPNDSIIFFPMHQAWNLLPGVKVAKSFGGKIIKPKFYTKLSRDNIKNQFIKSHKNEYNISKLQFPKIDLGNLITINLTKADTLRRLKPQLTKSTIEELIVFSVKEWKKSSKKIINQSQQLFKNNKVIIRSSSLNEDTKDFSNAGLFHSELDVNNLSKNDLISGVNSVIESYYQKKNFNPKNQIIIQKQTNLVKISGVCFTRNLKNNAPYYIINFDTNSDKTNTVTSGVVGNKIEIIRNIKKLKIPIVWKKFIKSIEEIEKLLPNIALDIEFAINKNNQIIIFQVRPLAANSKFPETDDIEIFSRVKESKLKFNSIKQHSLYSNNNFFSDMSFWNPAELIGDRPTNLALSLFDEILMNSIWNSSLQELGYNKVNSCLSENFLGKPYIDLNHTFNALIPSDIKPIIRNKLINFFNFKLLKHPEFHDKIEFEIILCNYNFNNKIYFMELSNFGFSKNEINIIKDSLLNLTNRIFNKYKYVFKKDSNNIKLLINSLNKKNSLNIKNKWRENLLNTFSLIQDLKNKGTPQFCRAARMAFIGKDILKSFYDLNTRFTDICESYLSSIKTVSTSMQKDIQLVCNKSMTSDTFFKKYGHLRPDTYNICHNIYSNDRDILKFTKKNLNNLQLPRDKIKTSSNKMKKEMFKIFDKYLHSNQLKIKSDSFFKFLKLSIQNREYFKFEYTKVLSSVIENLALVAKEFGFSKEDFSYIDINSLSIGLNANIKKNQLYEIWNNIINSRKSNSYINNKISLPSIIFNENDFDLIKNIHVLPNFVTNKIVKSEIIYINNKSSVAIDNKIVFIKNADPGYDWIFSHKIKGLVTQYGGLASHMAIRCAEFDIPAAIGCGVNIFENIKDSNQVILDCQNKKIEKLL